MKAFPRTPDASRLFPEIMKAADAAKLQKIFSIGLDQPDGSYPHWEKLKRISPPSGLTHEEHWVAVKMARNQARRSVKLRQKSGDVFWFTEPSCVRAQLSHLDLHAGGSLSSKGHELTPSDSDRYLARSLIEEPFSSSVLEGAATTRQAARRMIEGGVVPRTKDELMVLNNYRAMRYVKQIKDEELTPDIIIKIHKIITEGTMDNPGDCGRLRDDKDNVTVEDDITGEVLHFPPPSIELPKRLQEICNFANEPSDKANFIHPIIKAIILHFMIGYDHPFCDGNGRTARALFYWYVVKCGYWILEYVSISKSISAAPSQYGKAYLHTESDFGDLTYFIINQLDVLDASLNDLHTYIETRREKLQQFEIALGDQNINHRQSFLLNEAARSRIRNIDINKHQSIHKVSYLTARNDLEALTSLGYFRKIKRGRSNLYIPIQSLVEKLTRPE